MLREAKRKGMINDNPAARVEQLKETTKERGILDLEEARELLNENSFAKYWQNEVAFVANLLSATSGMRLGEVVALQVQDIRNGYVFVEHSWDRRIGLKSTKTRHVREIPIPRKTQRWLKRLMENRSGGYIFSTNNGVSPVYYRAVTDELYKALEKIGITPDERKLRNLSFHSWRHLYNSLLRGKVPDAKLQRLTGHRTQAMTDRYSHFSVDDFRDVLAIQEELAI
jgi:integrase